MTATLALLEYLTPAERRELDALLLAPDYERYRGDPVAWMIERMQVPAHTLRWSLNTGYESHQWDGTVDPLEKVARALAEWQSVGVESATGTGKTFFGALILLWFLDCFENSIVVTAAPKEKQLTLHIWKEIGKQWAAFKRLRPKADLSSLRIQVQPGSDAWGANGFVSGVGADEVVATKAAGFHAEHMLIITEETPGVAGPIMAAFENTCTAPHNLRLGFGNPDHQLDQLHLFCQSPGVTAVRISAFDHPNVVMGDASVIPGAVSAISIENRRQKYGEDSPLYQSRVRGISPPEATDALIKLEWLMAAVHLTPQEKAIRRAAGVAAIGHDVANSENGDRASIARGHGGLLEEVTSFRCPDAGEFARMHIHPLIGKGLAPERVGVDTVGVGASAFNELKRLGHRVQSLAGGAIPDPLHEEEFADLRSQMYWTFRQELFHLEIAIAREDQELFTDLVTPKWGTRNGMIFVEPKEILKKRLPGGRSPDKGDAAVYWNWVRKDRRMQVPPRRGLGSRTY